jgi:prolyl aminopeptidase (EC:3.4.11.5). Serine peptidase. MEROPS family S33
MKSLYPDIEPFHHFYLPTESAHSIYVEQSGNPEGIPVTFSPMVGLVQAPNPVIAVFLIPANIILF